MGTQLLGADLARRRVGCAGAPGLDPDRRRVHTRTRRVDRAVPRAAKSRGAPPDTRGDGRSAARGAAIPNALAQERGTDTRALRAVDAGPLDRAGVRPGRTHLHGGRQPGAAAARGRSRARSDRTADPGDERRRRGHEVARRLRRSACRRDGAPRAPPRRPDARPRATRRHGRQCRLGAEHVRGATGRAARGAALHAWHRVAPARDSDEQQPGGAIRIRRRRHRTRAELSRRTRRPVEQGRRWDHGNPACDGAGHSAGRVRAR